MRVLSTSLVVLPSLALSVSTGLLAQNGGASPPPPATERSVTAAYLVTVQGKVSDKATGKALSDAQVSIEGTRAGQRTGKDGMYKFTTSAVGAQKIMVKYIGYKTITEAVSLEDGKTLTKDFQMVESPKTLEAMTSTASGEQRKIEVGHTVATIHTDSVTKENVINGITDLLKGRVAGLSVSTSSGLVGSSNRIRIRGINSFALDNNPIVIIDGVRMTSTVSSSPALYGAGARSNPMDDLNPNDVESIEVVKGPSAATLYGTDASNGVIVIKTKKGQAGKMQTNGYYNYQGNSINLKTLGKYTIGVGHLTDSTDVTVICNLLAVASGRCVQDRLLTYNPLANKDLTIYKGNPSYLGGLNVSGGTNTLRFFGSADASLYAGALELPKGEQERIKRERGITEIADEIIHPNAQLKENGTINVTANLTPNYDLQMQNHLNLNNVRGDQYYLGLVSAYVALGYNNQPLNGGFGQYGGYTPPGNTFSEVAETQNNRWITSMTNNYRLFDGNVSFRGIAGVDYTNAHGTKSAKRGEGTILTDPTGFIAITDILTRVYTGDFSGTLEHDLSSWIHTGTSVGAQYTRTVLTGTGAVGHNLPPSNISIGSAALVINRDTLNETIKYGKYIEQRVAFNDRVFLSYALRSDGAASFGDSYKSALFPKSSVSWNILKEPWFPPFRFLDQLRLRFATGQSGIQPPVGAAIRTYQYFNQVPYGVYLHLANAGNPTLQPEKQAEREGGADVSLFGDRLYMEMTAWRRENTGLMISQSSLPGFGSQWRNLGEARLKGGEFVTNVTLLRTRPLEWTVNLNAAHNNSVLINAGGYIAKTGNGYVEGLGLQDFVDTRVVDSYSDANGNGILEASEIHAHVLGGDSVFYRGFGPNPRQEYTYQTSMNFFNNALRMSTTFQRRMKYGGYDYDRWGGCNYGFCKDMNDPATPLKDQLVAVALYSGKAYLYYPRYDNTQWAELSAAFNLPRMLTRMMRVTDASMSLSGRNLRWWASQASTSVVMNGGYPYSGSTTDYNWGYPNVPQGRLFQVRVDLRK